MKKVVHTETCGSATGEKTLTGFKEEINWSKTSYCGGPRGFGEFTVSDGDGKIYTRKYSEQGDRVFIKIMHCDCREGVTFSDSEVPLSNDELIKLYQSFYVWYYTEEVWNYDTCDFRFIICRGDAIPKYFLDPAITGPIDSEIDTYEETEYKFE